MDLMKNFGTDAFRLYMYQSNAMLIGDMMFDEAGLQKALQQILLPLWSASSFYTSYAIIDKFVYDENVLPKPDNQLDKWVLAALYDIETKITDKMDKYHIDKYVGEVVSLLDGLTNWYIRRSRRRFWGSEFTKDKKDAYETLSYVLVNICKLLAPAAPILTEKLYKHLTGSESVHLAAFPQIPKQYKNEKLLQEVELVQQVIHLARSIRTKNNVKNRQPLSKLQLALSNTDNIKIIEKSKQVICEELNVKEIEIIENVTSVAEVQYQPNFANLNKKYGAQVGAIIKAVKSKQFTVSGNNLVIEADGKKLTLDEEDVLVNYFAKAGLHIMSGLGIVVALDLTVTEELKREGVAREIVRNVQDARKQMSLDISDRIAICFSKEQPPEEWFNYIYSETLGQPLEFDLADATCEIETDKGTILVKIKKQ